MTILLYLIVSHDAPTVRFKSRKQLIYEGEAINICVSVRGPFSVLTLTMELYEKPSNSMKCSYNSYIQAQCMYNLISGSC